MCRSISNPVIKVPSSSKKRNENWWRLSRRSKKWGKDATVDVHIRKFTHFENVSNKNFCMFFRDYLL